MKRKRVRVALVLLLVALVAIACLLVPGKTRPAVLPQPNGFDDFLRAAEIVGGYPVNYTAMDPEALRGLLSTNAEVLRLVRVGLARESRVPFQYIVERSASPTGIAQFSSLKNLFFLLLAEGKLAENEARTNDAMRSYLDLLGLGESMSRGGVLIDKLQAFAARRQALGGLFRLKLSLPDDQCQQAIQTLKEVSAHREPFAEVWALDQEAAQKGMRQSDRTWSGIRALLTRAVMFRQIRDLQRKMKTSFLCADAELDLMILEFSIRRHVLATGSYPKTLRELADKYRMALPSDPFSDAGLIYKVGDKGYLLYSVGPNGKDDGGKPPLKGNPQTGLDGDLLWGPNLEPEKPR